MSEPSIHGHCLTVLASRLKGCMVNGRAFKRVCAWAPDDLDGLVQSLRAVVGALCRVLALVSNGVLQFGESGTG